MHDKFDRVKQRFKWKYLVARNFFYRVRLSFTACVFLSACVRLRVRKPGNGRQFERDCWDFEKGLKRCFKRLNLSCIL